MSEFFAGKPLVNSEREEFDGGEALKGKKVVVLYFSAMWCGSCRQFTPKLKRFYKACKDAGKEIEFILISRDREEDDLFEYLESCGEWLAVPFGDERIGEFIGKYEVPTIPAIKLIAPNGDLVADVRNDIVEKAKDDPIALFEEWESKINS